MSTDRKSTPDGPHDFAHDSTHDSVRDGLGPIPALSPNQWSTARTMLLAQVEEDLRDHARPVPGRRARPQASGGGPVRSRRGLLAVLSAVSVAGLAAATVYFGGGFDAGGSGPGSVVAGEPVLPMSAVAYTLPSAAVTTRSSECITSKGSTADGDGLRYLINEDAAGSTLPPLTSSMVRTDNCFTTGWPAASFIATTADGRHLTQAITVWGPGVQGLSAPSSDNRVRASAVGDHSARVLVADWGVLESWTTAQGTWSITGAGADEATVQRLAETVAASSGIPSATDLQARLPGLLAVPVPATPSTPYSSFSAAYGAESIGDNATDRLELDVSPARVPWAAWASTGPLAGTELIDVDGVTGWSVQDADDPFGMLVWEVAPGVSALLRGQVDGSKDLTAYARTVREVTADDPRIQASDVDR